MNKEFIDKVLDEGLKNYSRVTPPEDLAALVAARAAAAQAGGPEHWLRVAGGWFPRRWWLWAPAPLAAAAMLAAMLLRPPVETPGVRPTATPPVAARTVERPAVVKSVATPPARRLRRRPSGLRVLTAADLAALQLPAELFRKDAAAEQPLPDLSIPELVIPALGSETE